MNMALAMTAVHQGTVAANHTEVVALHKDSNGKLNGARLKDNITGEEFNVKAKVSDPIPAVLRTVTDIEHTLLYRVSSTPPVHSPTVYVN